MEINWKLDLAEAEALLGTIVEMLEVLDLEGADRDQITLELARVQLSMLIRQAHDLSAQAQPGLVGLA